MLLAALPIYGAEKALAQAPSGYFRAEVTSLGDGQKHVWVLQLIPQGMELDARFFSDSRDLDIMRLRQKAPHSWEMVRPRVGRICVRDSRCKELSGFELNLRPLDSERIEESYAFSSPRHAGGVRTIYHRIADHPAWGRKCILQGPEKIAVELFPLTERSFALYVSATQEILPEWFELVEADRLLVRGLFQNDRRGEGSMHDQGFDWKVGAQVVSCRWQS
jgi:hypothetical protein